MARVEACDVRRCVARWESLDDCACAAQPSKSHPREFILVCLDLVD